MDVEALIGLHLQFAPGPSLLPERHGRQSRVRRALVRLFRSPHHSCWESETRTSEIKAALVSFDSEVRKRVCRRM